MTALKDIEILAPAGGFEQLEAAVRSGADAVYLGLDGFNARQNAKNFTDPNEIVSYCHARGVKVHFTLNTLINDEEIPALYEMLKKIAGSGADAVIVQDLAVAKIVRECCPDLPLHASTQMTVHNLEGVRVLERLNFSRVVLARELNLDEIRYIAENTSLEIETFVHGALCMCMSGACYLSSMLGGRSGNRGFCAQPCRLNFHLRSKQYALSLKDMCHIPYVEELAAAGVCSLKIEGRMKRPEYVAAAVDACIRKRAGEVPDLETLKAVFSRSGFTDGYLSGKRNADMFGYRTRDDVVAADGILKKIRGLIKDERQSVPVNMKFVCRSGRQSVLSANALGETVEVLGEVPRPAQNRPMDEEMLKKQFSKTGGTQFFVDEFYCDCGENLNLPLTELNAMRRRVLEALSQKLAEIRPHAFKGCEFMPETGVHDEKVKIYVRCEKVGQADKIKSADLYILPPAEILNNPELTKKFGEKLVCAPEQMFFDGLKAEKILEKIKNLGVKKILADNIGWIEVAERLGFETMGGHGLNILNSLSLGEYARLGLSEAVVSYELSAAKIAKLKDAIPFGIIAYGHLPLMQMRACPASGKTGCGNCDGHPVITDRMGNEFKLQCNSRRFTTLLNPVALDLRGRPVKNVDFYLLKFTDETPDECGKIFSDYKNINSKSVAAGDKITRGLYFREIQ